jgi:hypothetical protein
VNPVQIGLELILSILGGRDRQHDRAYIRNMHSALRYATSYRSINSRALPAAEAQAWMMARAEAVGN